MSHLTASDSFYQFLCHVYSIDFGPLAYQLMYSRLGPQWTHQQATHAIARYLMFLYLVDHYSHLQLVPPEDIDRVWHHHILDTQKYEQDCQRLFGYFIHHHCFEMPTEGDRQRWHCAYALTQVLFRKQFGFGLETIPATGESNNPFTSREDTTVPVQPHVSVAIDQALQSLFALD